MKWKLNRPVAFFDIEATGKNPRADRIVELAIIKLMPDGGREEHVFRVNPERPMSAEVIAIHGITDADVKDCPTFAQIAPKVLEILRNCDLGGYNLLHFDIPMLIEEFARLGMKFDDGDRAVVDAQRIYHKREPRDLSAALSFYCGELHLGAHGALDDVLATIRVLEGQLDRYTDLPQDMESLDAYCNTREPSWVDRSGKLKWADGEVVLNFGKNAGKKLRDYVQFEPSYLKWLLKSDFPRDTKDIVQNALEGKYPAPPAKPDEA